MSRIIPLALLSLSAALHAQEGQAPAPTTAQTWEPVIEVDGQAFATWEEYVYSDLFQQRGLRCATHIDEAALEQFRVPSDCATSTTIKPEYQPAAGPLYRIPVVVHVLRSSSGAGNVSDGLIRSQIDVLNEDFQAIAGSLGQNGTHCEIEFFLATTDPSGNPTTGITRSNDTNWFNDSGDYWTPLHWDTTRYLNIYTNQASGALGYVPSLPFQGIVGAANDRVVCLWSAMGRNAPIGSPYNLGRTVTHEVGHYLGLYHTFQNGCATGSCYSGGDRICDTNNESSPFFGCGSRVTCGNPDPIDNYMDYSDDICMEMFTPEQANRMRCTLENWRVDLADTGPPTCNSPAKAVSRNAGSNPPAYGATAPVLGGNLQMSVISAIYNNAVVIGRAAPANTVLPDGRVLLVDLSSALMLKVTVPINGNLSLPVPNDVNLCNLNVYTQVVMFGGAPTPALTNAMDLIVGI
jgi:hypothetical protein